MDMNILHSEDATVLEIDARLGESLVKQLEKFRFAEDVKFLDAGSQLARLSLIGPKAAALLGKVADAGIESLNEPLRHARRTIAKTTVTIFRLDQCGEAGYELIAPRDYLVQLWQILHEAGNGHGEAHDNSISLRAIGWSAFNTARIEAGTPLLASTSRKAICRWRPALVSARRQHHKGCYLGQEIVARMHAHNAASRLLVGLRVEGERMPIAGTDILDGPAQVGMITSSCTSPMLGGVPIAMGYAKRGCNEPGHALEVLAEGTRAKATVVELPFWNGLENPTRPARMTRRSVG